MQDPSSIPRVVGASVICLLLAWFIVGDCGSRETTEAFEDLDALSYESLKREQDIALGHVKRPETQPAPETLRTLEGGRRRVTTRTVVGPDGKPQQVQVIDHGGDGGSSRLPLVVAAVAGSGVAVAGAFGAYLVLMRRPEDEESLEADT